jgi:shikimate dehydrogenase
MNITGRTKTAGVIGWPVSGSLSPSMHNTAFASLGLDWVYVPLPVPPGQLAAALEGLGAAGFSGLNVTMPHKTESAALAQGLTDDATRLGAVNTLVARPEGWEGHNTDAPGFATFLREDAGFDASGAEVLVYGAGGAARACALALAESGAGTVHVAVREPDRARELLTSVEGLGARLEVIRLADAPRVRADLIVNATPLGTSGEGLPTPELASPTVVVDLIYGVRTPLVEAAVEGGCAAFDGLGLLLHQAALSFELWTGQEAPLRAMADALRTP